MECGGKTSTNSHIGVQNGTAAIALDRVVSQRRRHVVNALKRSIQTPKWHNASRRLDPCRGPHVPRVPDPITLLSALEVPSHLRHLNERDNPRKLKENSGNRQKKGEKKRIFRTNFYFIDQRFDLERNVATAENVVTAASATKAGK